MRRRKALQCYGPLTGLSRRGSTGFSVAAWQAVAFAEEPYRAASHSAFCFGAVVVDTYTGSPRCQLLLVCGGRVVHGTYIPKWAFWVFWVRMSGSAGPLFACHVRLWARSGGLVVSGGFSCQLCCFACLNRSIDGCRFFRFGHC